MIYILEDDNSIRELIVYSLNNSGLKTMGFERPSEFWAQMKKQIPSLILLDIMLPEEDGLMVLQKLRAKPETKKVSVIMLTAKGTEYDKVKGLDSGADDYVAKPFGMMELISRVKAHLRRVEDLDSEKSIQIGNLAIFPDQHKVKVDGHAVELTLKEFELLQMMMSNPGIVFSRDRIQDSIWGYAFDGESRTVDVHIRTLRQKLGSAGSLVKTVRGVGYCVDLPE